MHAQYLRQQEAASAGNTGKRPYVKVDMLIMRHMVHCSAIRSSTMSRHESLCFANFTNETSHGQAKAVTLVHG